MNSDDNATNLPADSQPVGDLNVERLLGKAYQPETPDSEFVKRVEAMMVSAAREGAEARASESPRVTIARRPVFQWRKLAWSAVAATILVVVGFVVGRQMGRPAGEGLASRPAGSEFTQNHFDTPFVQPPVTDALFLKQQIDSQDSRTNVLVGDRGLTPRPRPAAPAIELLAIGDELQTESGQRRRVTLADDSILYLNENTRVSVEAERQIALSAGEIYVEVSPRLARPVSGTEANNGNEGESGEAPATFVVKSAGREITAIGTKFAVRAGSHKADVLVTQGKVQVTDVDQPIAAGQQLAVLKTLDEVGPDNSAPAVTPLPRASHVLDWTRDLMAAAESPLVPASPHAGGSIVARDPNGQEARLSLRKYHVDVHIEDGFARTTIDQTYFNHTSWRLEGTFHFPLPPDASLSRLAMYVEGKLMEGGMAERNYAREVFEKIVRTQKDPALLEWVDGSTFKMRVFPLEARQEKRIILSYTQRLDALYGNSKYRFPTGHSLDAVRDWSFHARVKNGAEFTWSGDSHELKPSKDAGDLVLDAEAKEVKLDRDVVLRLTDRSHEFRRPLTPNPSPPKRGEGSPFSEPNEERSPSSPLSLSARRGAGGEGSAIRFSSTEHDGQRYLMLRYRPDLPTKAQRQRRDWVFLFESSGDRDPVLARVQVDVIKTLLQNAEHDDTFAILTAGTQVRTFANEPLPATPENVKKAVEFLDGVHLVGALDLGQALTAAEPFVKAGKNAYLVHVGSGMPVLGERSEDKLLKRIPTGARYVGVGVGKRWSRQFMKTAASRTGGYFTQINPDEPVAWRAFDLYSTLNTPRLLNAAIVDHAERAAFLVYNDSIAHGEELCAIARVSAAERLPEKITVSGTLDGEPFRRVITVENISDKADYLPRTWAKLRIDQLLAADAAKHKDEIISLSKAMYVMSPFTSLLVLENEQMYVQFNIDRGRKDHWAMYPCPKQIPVVYEPPPAPAVAEPVVTETERTGKKPSPAQVLSTIVVSVPLRSTVSPSTTSYYSLAQTNLGLVVSPNDNRVQLGLVPANIGQADVQGLDELGVIILRGNPQDVENMKNIVEEVERISQGTSLPMREYRLGLALEGFKGRYGVASPGQAIANEGEYRFGRFDSYGLPTVRPLSETDRGVFSKQLRQFFSPSNRSDGLVVPGNSARFFEGVTDYGMSNGTISRLFDFPDGLSNTAQFGGGFGYYARRRFRDVRDGTSYSFSMGEVAGGESVSGSWGNPFPLYSAFHSSDDFVDVRPWGIDQAWGVSRVSGFPRGHSFESAFQYVGPDFSINGNFETELPQPMNPRLIAPQGNPVGRGRLRNLGRGPGDGGGVKRSDRWEINFSAAPSDAEYARQLDQFGIELGAIANRKAYLASKLASPKPTVQVSENSIAGNRLYFSWRGSRRTQSDLNLLSRAGVPITGETIVLHLYPLETEQLLAKLERDFLRDRQGHTDMRLVRKTAFGVRRVGAQYEVSVVRQEYFGSQTAAVGQSKDRVLVRANDWDSAAIENLAAAWLRASGTGPTLTYQRPTAIADMRIFDDLLTFTPGLQTSRADVFAVLESEASLEDQPATGKVDSAARDLIETARSRGWQALTIAANEGRPAAKIYFDGADRYSLDRMTRDGLREQVISDGTALWHLYPELGIGARRGASRFHRAAFAALVPWTVSRAEDFVNSGDVVLIDRRTVAIIPFGVDGAKDADGEPAVYWRLHLVFADDGRLAERRLVEMPDGKVLARETYSAEGTVRLLDADEKVLSEQKFALEPAAAPNLAPDTKNLVILPLPFRGGSHVAPIWAKAPNRQFGSLNDDDALALIAACLPGDAANLREIIGQRFFAKGDRHVGFYTLLMASGRSWDPQGDQVMADGSHVRFDPVADHPDSSLARYVFLHQQQMTKSGKIDEMDLATGPGGGFVERLAAFRDLHVRWTSGKATGGSDAERKKERERALEFARASKSPLFGWAVLTMVQNHGGDAEFYRALAEAFRTFERTPGLAYAARYESAYCVRQSGDWQKAMELFRGVHAQTLKQGIVPPVEQSFRQAFQSGGNGPALWTALWREAADKVIAQGDRRSALAMAGQCHKLGDTAMADELFATTMRGVADDDRAWMTLAAVGYLSQTEQFARADALLQPMLEDDRFSQIAWLWRLGAGLAEKHGMTARSVACLDRAMDIEYSRLPDEVDLESVRAAFGSLLERYQKLADSIASLQSEPPTDIVRRVIRAADRWRSLDPDDTAACQAASRVLQRLGVRDAAWEYVTTPLADRPGEAPPWSSLAGTLRGQNEFDLADRAYRSAFDAEPTNAQILWDHAQMLEQRGHTDEARQFYRKIAKNSWGPEFQSIQEQARKFVATP